MKYIAKRYEIQDIKFELPLAEAYFVTDRFAQDEVLYRAFLVRSPKLQDYAQAVLDQLVQRINRLKNAAIISVAAAGYDENSASHYLVYYPIQKSVRLSQYYKRLPEGWIDLEWVFRMMGSLLDVIAGIHHQQISCSSIRSDAIFVDPEIGSACLLRSGRAENLS